MTPRSYLFVPADRPERYAKAVASGPDAVIVDLEDAVAPAAKDAARQSLAEWLAGPGNESVIVRINSSGTPWFAADLDLVARATRVEAVMLPKAELDSPWSVFDGKPVIALVETAAGLANARAIARHPQVRRMAFGSIDYALDLGIDGDDEALLPARAELVLASRVANLSAPIDGVCTSISDTSVFAAHVRRARRLGFGAVLCIHPSQVDAVNEAFQPTAQQIDWARRVIAASQQSSGAAVAVDGKMVDRPVFVLAESILAAALCERKTRAR